MNADEHKRSAKPPNGFYYRPTAAEAVESAIAQGALK